MASTYQWNGGSGLATDASQWTLVGGPADGGTPQAGDTAIATTGSISFPLDAMLSANTLYFGSATLSFTGDGTISLADPTVDAASLISTAVPGASTAETGTLDSVGAFVNAGTIQADGPAGSTLTLALSENGASIPGDFTNTGLIGVDAGNTLTLTEGSNSAFFDDGTLSVSGSGASLTTAAQLLLGNAASGTLVIDDGGEVTDQNVLWVGDTAGGAGQITIDAGSTLDLSGTAQTTQQLIVAGALASGGSAAASGIVTVTGSLALLESNGPIAIGRDGPGSLIVTQGGSAVATSSNSNTSSAVSIGEFGAGMVTIDGTSSELTANGLMYVGRAGTGSLLLENGGSLVLAADLADNAGEITIGVGNSNTLSQTGGSGTVTVTSGAVLNSGSLILVGGRNDNGTLTVDGGTVEAEFIGLGRNTTISSVLYGGTGILDIGTTGLVETLGTATTSNTVVLGQDASASGTATVAGVLDSNGALVIGGAGAGMLTVNQDGSVTAGQVVVAGETSAVGHVTLDGGALTESGGGFVVGAAGIGDLTIEAGSTVTATHTAGPAADIGLSLDSTGSVVVAGAHSLFQVNGQFIVGDIGTGMLSLSAGGSVDATGAMDIGNQNGGNGTVTVDAATLTAADGLSVGNLFGTGSNHGTLIVSNGGSVGVGGTGFTSLALGQSAGAVGTVSVTGATLDSTVGIVIGNAGTGTLSASLGSTITTAGITIGSQDDGVGGLTLDASSLANSGAVTIGGADGSTGALTVQDGGVLTSTGSIGAGWNIGQSTGSTGTVIVDAGTLGASGGFFGVGQSGTGELTIEAGGTVTAGETSGPGVDIGSSTGGTGTVTVTGTQSLLQVTGELIVGDAGAGTLSVAAGASLDAPGGFDIGNQNGGSGMVTVDAATLTADDGLSIGNLFATGSDSGALTVRDGGTVGVTGTGFASFAIGSFAGTSGTVTVDGGALSATISAVDVGSSGTGALTIEAGGTMTATSGAMSVGQVAGGSGTVTVTGTSSLLQVNGTLQVGSMSSGALTVSAGGSVDSTMGVSIGLQNGASGSVTVNDASLTESGEFSVGGGFGSGTSSGTLTVQDGGSVIANGGSFDGLYIAQAASATGTVTVDDGSLSETGGGLDVGSVGTGELTIEAAGTVTSTLSLGAAVDIGAQTGSQGNVTLTGTASLLQVNGQLTVGDQGSGTLSIGAGSTADVTGNVTIGNQGTATGTVSVSGAGALLEASGLAMDFSPSLTATGVLTVGSGGTVSLGSGQIAAGGTVLLQGGAIIDSGSAFDIAPGALMQGDGTLSGSLIADGTVTATGGLLAITGNVGGNHSGAGDLAISPAATLSVSGGISTPDVTFSTGGTGEVLGLGDPGGTGATLQDFAAGDTIWLTGVDDSGATVQAGASADVLTITDNSSVIANLALSGGDYDTDHFDAYPDTNGGTDIVFTAACYAAGTRVATPRGPVTIEALRPGDLVLSGFGGSVPVAWIGHRRVDCRRHLRPQEVWPIRVRAGAFGEGRPARDLRLSPDHAVYVADVLIPIRCLINHVTVTQEPVPEITYLHVELPAHDVILAEGLPAESYLDTGNRSAFANGGPMVDQHPDFAQRVWEAEACAAQITHGPILAAVVARLHTRAQQIGDADRDAA